MRFPLIGALLLLLFSSSCVFGKEIPKLLFTVKRNYEPIANEKATLVLDWKEAVKRLPVLKTGIILVDWNFGKEVKAVLADTNKDGAPDQIIIDYIFPSNDPVFSFYMSPSSKKNEWAKDEHKGDPKFEITFLTSSGQKKVVKNWPDKIIES